MGGLAVTFWPGHCLGQGKMAFGNSFVWILSISMRTHTKKKKEKNIKMSHMVDDLRPLP